jgi:hypothetical protein
MAELMQKPASLQEGDHADASTIRVALAVRINTDA